MNPTPNSSESTLRAIAPKISAIAKDHLLVIVCRSWLRRYGLVLLTYLGVTWFTDAHFMADTVGYAEEILAFRLSEFGHLLLYPLGWAVSRMLAPFTSLIIGADERTNIIMTLVIINWVAGLLSVFVVRNLANRVSQQEWIANFVTLAFIFSHGFLNFAQTGCSYVPGLSLLLLGLYLLLRDADKAQQSWRTAILAGVGLGAAVSLWFPYVLSLPAALASPLLVFGSTTCGWRLVLRTSLACLLTITLVYSSGAALGGIHTIAGLIEWFVSTSDGATGANGVARMVFGLARSFINLGNDGKIFKQFLVHDPFNSVSLLEIFRLSLLKLGLFYLFLGSLIFTLLLFRRGRRMVAFLVLNGVPVAVFAVMWQGGDIERYLPLYPGIFLALSCALAGYRVSTLFKFIAMTFVTVTIVTNVGAMATTVLNHRQEQVVARIKDLQPLLKPQSVVATVHQQDEVWAFYWTFPFHSINRAGSLSTYQIVGPNSSRILLWRQMFAAKVLSVWAAGGDVWISMRVLSPRPHPEWNWVEGDDPRISWVDITEFFSNLEIGSSVGSDDGFVLLLPSPKNGEFLGHWSSLGMGMSTNKAG